jgi:hypothetical protein
MFVHIFFFKNYTQFNVCYSFASHALQLQGHAVAQLVEALRYKPEGSIPNGVTGPLVDSTSNRNERQEYFLHWYCIRGG